MYLYAVTVRACVIVMQPYLLRLAASSSSRDDEDHVSRTVSSFFFTASTGRPPGRDDADVSRSVALDEGRRREKETDREKTVVVLCGTLVLSRSLWLILCEDPLDGLFLLVPECPFFFLGKNSSELAELASFLPDKYRPGSLDLPECAMKR